MSKVLVVDDEKKIVSLLSDHISADGYDVETRDSAEEALRLLGNGEIDIVLCDLRLGGMDGIELLKETRKISPGTDFVMMTAYASAETAIEAMRNGAYEYLIKPFQVDEVLMLLRRIQERRDLMTENLALKERISNAAERSRIIGTSKSIGLIIELIDKVAPTDSPVLILGESGTGKELVAAEIHRRSRRSDKPFIIINCAALPENLLEAEMFGHEKGAFTGAVRKKPGQFKLADGGSLFLDEIGELSPSLQAKLLRAIENGEFLPVGSSRRIKVDVRIIAATNRDLTELIKGERFREDLFYRLNVFPITIPPLRERKEDIGPIAEAFLSGRGYTGEMGPGTMGKLGAYGWPGNVRELRNVLERAMILAGDSPLEPGHMMIPDSGPDGPPGGSLAPLVGEKSLEEIERTMIILALERSGGNKSRAAELLGITRRTLYSRMDKYGI
jgi:DNA-binding NtrC family response regulator